MIDEAELTAKLREAVDAIEIPTGAADRVLATRDLAGPPRRSIPSPRRRTRPSTDSSLTSGIGRGPAIAIVLAAVVVLFVAVGLASGHHGSTSHASAGTSVAGPSAGGVPSTTVASGASSAAGASSGGVATSGGGVALPSAAPSSAATTVPSSEVPPLVAQVIKTGSLALTVKAGTVGASVDRLSSLASGEGGYVQNSQSTTAGPSPTATVTLRVPVANFNQLVTQSETLGKVTSLTSSGQDVTAQSVDLAAQIQALQASRDQFLQILTKAQTIGDILSVEQQISALQDQINQLQGQQKVLNDQTSYSTLTVTVTQPAAAVIIPPPPPRPKSGLSSAWAHARHSFTHGVESVVSASGGLAVFLLCVGVIGLIGWVGWRIARRRLV